MTTWSVAVVANSRCGSQTGGHNRILDGVRRRREGCRPAHPAVRSVSAWIRGAVEHELRKPAACELTSTYGG